MCLPMAADALNLKRKSSDEDKMDRRNAEDRGEKGTSPAQIGVKQTLPSRVTMHGWWWWGGRTVAYGVCSRSSDWLTASEPWPAALKRATSVPTIRIALMVDVVETPQMVTGPATFSATLQIDSCASGANTPSSSIIVTSTCENDARHKKKNG